MSAISHRTAKANDKYLPDYNSSKEESYLIQSDLNSLQGDAMSGHLLVDSFKWADEMFSIEDLIEINKLSENTNVFFLLKLILRS